MNLPHHVSRNRSQMPLRDRAAQFAAIIRLSAALASAVGQRCRAAFFLPNFPLPVPFFRQRIAFVRCQVVLYGFPHSPKGNEIEMGNQSNIVSQCSAASASKHILICSGVFFSKARFGRAFSSKYLLDIVSRFSTNAPLIFLHSTKTLQMP